MKTNDLPGAIPLCIEDDLGHVMALNDLAHWINKARDYAENIRHIASTDSAFAERLRLHNFPINHAERSDEAGSGLEYLHMNITLRLMSIRKLSSLSGGDPR